VTEKGKKPETLPNKETPGLQTERRRWTSMKGDAEDQRGEKGSVEEKVDIRFHFRQGVGQ